MTRQFQPAGPFTLALCAAAASSTLLFCILTATPALALTNPERHYEMVSPVYKGGFGVDPTDDITAAADGERVAFITQGTFEGAPAGGSLNTDYIAHRGPSGWSSSPLMPPAGLLVHPTEQDLSPNLDVNLWVGQTGPNAAKAEKDGALDDFLLHSTVTPDVTAEWQLIGNPLEGTAPTAIPGYSHGGSDPNFCHLVMESPEESFPSDTGEAGRLSELTRGCHGAPSTFTVLDVNDESPARRLTVTCHFAGLGSQGFEEGGGPESASQYNAISADGESIFFNECISPFNENGEVSHHQLFVRLGGSKTLEVSKSLAAPDSCAETSLCASAFARASATFVGASEDGSRVFFNTRAPLVAEDKDTGNDLYMARIGCEEAESGCPASARVVRSLQRISRPAAGGESGLEGVVRVAPDGSRVYFVASGELLSAEQRHASEGAGRPVPATGADNLYVYSTAGDTVTFVAALCSGLDESGNVSTSMCPGGSDIFLWRHKSIEEIEAQTAGLDGRFLVFPTYAQLAQGDTDAAKDVYRFDAETGRLTRVSVGEGGFDANGNKGAFDAVIQEGSLQATVALHNELRSRAISEDGSRIVFETAAPLSPAAANHLVNLYEWHEGGSPEDEGEVSLISSGSSTDDVKDAVISRSGRDVFFITSQGLLPQDIDGANDIYDARLEGGFPAAAAPRQPCSGDACQGPLSTPLPLLSPGSASQSAEGAPGVAVPAAAKPRAVAPVKKHKRKRHRRRGSKHVVHAPRAGASR
jgi:hypothetical protein